MAKKWSERAFGLIEIILSVGLWVLIGVGGISMVLGSLRLNRTGGDSSQASILAAEGIDAVRSIRKQGWTTPFLATNCTSGCGLSQSGGLWAYSGTNNTIDKYTRSVSVVQSNRDGSGNIVDSGGTADSNTYKVTSTVSWNLSVPPFVKTISTSTYLTNFAKAIGGTRKGMLVYGDGGTTSDAIKYRTFDGTNWSAPAATADVDTGSTNKYLRAVKIYASSTRDEKIVVSRHYNGTSQWIYAQVWNGTSWGNVKQLATWTATTFLDVQNFDGSYLSNGDFMVVYSDNTTTPKMWTWNGTAWAGAAVSLNAVTGTPIHVFAQVRPGTSEVMAGFLTSSNNTTTEYFNGGAYLTANWSAVTVHASAVVTNTKREIDFHWSSNTPTIGILGFSNQANDKKFTAKAFQANGIGGGTWGSAFNAANQTNNLGSLNMVDRPGANEMAICDKDAAATPTIVCRGLTFSGTTITWTTPTNPIVSSTSDTGIQRSFDLGYEGVSGTPAINVYDDNTTVLKMKSYNPATNTWDAAATSLMTFDSVPRSVDLVSKPATDDFMVLTANTSLDLFSFGWNGAGSAPYPFLLGSNNVSTSLDTNSAGIAEAFPFTANASGNATTVYFYINSTATAPTYYAGIYSDNAGHPGSLLGSASTTPVNGAWNSVSFSSVSLTSGTKYWIALLGITSGNSIFRDVNTGCAVGNTSEIHATSTLTSLPATWTTGTTFSTCTISAFVPTDGMSFTPHGNNGSNTTDYWFDFAWDLP